MARTWWAIGAVLAVCLVAGSAQALVINAGSGDDVVTGSADADTLSGGSGRDTISGLGGDDALFGGSGDDTLSGGDGHDLAEGDSGADQVDGGADNDVLSGDSGADVLLGGAGHDQIEGDSGSDELAGGLGNDLLLFDGGSDSVDGGDGHDVVLRGAGNGSVSGGSGTDLLAAPGNGGMVSGGDGDDVLHAGGHSGSVTLSGGPGSDVCYIEPGDAAQGCESVVTLANGSGSTPNLTFTGGPAQDATISGNVAAFSFAAPGATAIWCVADGVRSSCSGGTLSMSGLAAGWHTLAVFAVRSTKAPTAGVLRRFRVEGALPTTISGVVSSAAETVQVSGFGFDLVSQVRVLTGDGQTISYSLPHPRVELGTGAGGLGQQLTIVDPNLGAETITGVELRVGSQVAASAEVNVVVATAVVLSGATAADSSTLVVSGANLTTPDFVSLVHDGGTLLVDLDGPGVVVGDGQIIITSAALQGLHVSQIDAILAVDGMEVLTSLQVDISFVIVDTVPPVVEVPADLSLEATGPAGAVFNFAASAVDAVDGALGVTCTWVSGSWFSLGNTTVVCSATDAAGNVGQAQFVVSVVDTISPALSLPSEVAVEAVDVVGQSVTYSASAVDAVDGALQPVCSPPSGAVFTLGSTMVDCAVGDSAGNTASASFMVSVLDTIAPTLVVQSPHQVEIDNPEGEPIAIQVSATDSLEGELAASCSHADGAVLTAGSYEVTCEASDSSGNQGTVSFTLQVSLRDAYSEATGLIEDQHPIVLQERYEPNLPTGALDVVPNPTTAITEVSDGNGGTTKVMSQGTFGYPDDEGDVRRLDTSLQLVGGSYRPVAVPYDVQIPRRYADAMVFGLPNSNDVVTATPLQARPYAAPGELVADASRVLYPNAFDATHVVVTPFEAGVREHLVLTGPAAPAQFAWDLEVPSGWTLAIDEGVVTATSPGAETFQLIDSPSAVDAAGQLVPVDYQLNPTPTGVQLVLAYETTPDLTDSGGLTQPITWPLDIDPDFEDAQAVALYTLTSGWDGNPEVVNNTTDDKGTFADCSGSSVLNKFQGKTISGQARQFRSAAYGAYSRGAASVCSYPSPTSESSWYSLTADVAWSLSDGFIANVGSGGEPAPGVSGRVFEEFRSGGLVAPSGTDRIVWDEQHGGPPADGQDIRIATRAVPKSGGMDPRLSGGVKRTFALTNVTRTFYDEGDPTLTVYPVWDGRLVSPGTLSITSFAEDDESGCKVQTIHFLRDGAPYGDTATQSPCGEISLLTTSLDAVAAGEYTLVYRAEDYVGNVSEEEHTVTVADPLASPDTGDVLSGIAEAELQIADDLPLDSVRLDLVRTVSGSEVRFQVGSSITTPGEHTVSWDTAEYQNGPARLELILRQPGGIELPLDSVEVDLNNHKPMQGALGPNSGTTDLGSGLQALHSTGAVTTSVTDVSQPGANGESLLLTRTYNSQDTHTGLLGKGWSTPWEQHLSLASDAVIFTDAQGREWPFLRDGSLVDTIPAAGQAGMLTTTGLPTEPWVITYPDGKRTYFDASGHLTRETWPGNRAIAYSSPPASTGMASIAIADAHGNQITGTVDEGRLVSATNAAGDTWTYGYDGAGRLATITDPAGATTTLTYNLLGNLAGVSDPLGRQTSVTYTQGVTDSDELIMQVSGRTAPDSTVMTIEHSGDGIVEATVGDRTTTTEVDPLGQVVATTDAEGNETSTTYNVLGQITAAVDENGEETTNTYDEAGHLTAETDAEGNTTTYENFTSDGQPTVVSDPEGNQTNISYDSAGRKTTEQDPDGSITDYSYNGDAGMPVSKTNSLGQVTYLEHSRTGQVTAEYYLDSNGDPHWTQRATFDEAGRMLTKREGDLPAWSYQYDDTGRVTTTTDPLGNTTSNTYDAAGQVLTHTDQLGNTTTTTYDVLGNTATVTDPLGNTTSYDYNTHSELVSTTDPLGNETTSTYDNVGNVVSTTDPLNRTTTYTYDGTGNQTSETDPAGFTTSTQYNSNGDETVTTHPDGTTTRTSYDQRGNATTDTNELGHFSREYYTPAGYNNQSANLDEKVSATGYDAAHRVTSNTDELGRDTSYDLDQLGRTTQTTYADGATTSQTYDDAGRVTSTTDERGNATVLSHDALGRILTKQYPDGATATYTYDAAGNLRSETMSDGSGTTYGYDDANRRISRAVDPDGNPANGVLTTTYTYDDAGRLRTETDHNGGVTQHFYNAAGERTQMIDPAGTITLYSYDARGLLHTQATGDEVVTHAYNSRGSVVSTTDASGAVTSFTYDAAQQVDVRTAADGSSIDYDYDRMGRVIRETHSVAGVTEVTYSDTGMVLTRSTDDGTTAYEYDARDRVVRITYPSGDEASFSYDAAGSLLEVVDSAGTRSYSYDSRGRVASYTALDGRVRSYTYDDAGRVVYAPVSGTDYLQYTYDKRGFLSLLNTHHPDERVAYSEYSPSGRWARREFPGGRVLVAEFDAAERPLRLGFSSGGGGFNTYLAYDAAGRVSASGLNPLGVGSPQLHGYSYTDRGQLSQWRFDNARFVSEYQYDAAGRIVAEVRTVANIPTTGQNTPAEDEQIRHCIEDAAWCPVNIRSRLQLISGVFPQLPGLPAIAGADLLIVRYLQSHPGVRIVVKQFTYNPAGQLVGVTQPMFPSSIPRTYSYDARGRVVSDTGHMRVYDAQSHLTGFATDSGDSVQMTYTHNGLLTTSTLNGETITYTYDALDRVEEIHTETASSSDRLRLTYDTAGLVMITRGTAPNEQVYYPAFNQRGDLVALTSPTGLIGTITYTPYGNHTTSTTATTLTSITRHLNYNTQQGVIHNPHTNHHWMHARHYNPHSHQYLSPDPLPTRAGSPDTAYSYAGSDPVNQTDPSGMAAKPTTPEKRWCGTVQDKLGIVRGGLVCRKAQRLERSATRLTNRLYSGSDAADGHLGNAFKHGYWIAATANFLLGEMPTQADAAKFAKTLGDAHEEGTYQPCINAARPKVWADAPYYLSPNELCDTHRSMDDHNNAEGATAGVTTECPKQKNWIRWCIQRKVNAGDMLFVRFTTKQRILDTGPFGTPRVVELIVRAKTAPTFERVN